MKFYLTIAICTFLIVYCVTPLMRRLAIKYNILDHPSSSIKTHVRATPYLGGAAIFLGVFSSLIVLLIVKQELLTTHSLLYIALLTVVFGIGLFDDLRPIKPLTRLIVHLIVAAISVSLGFHVRTGLPVFIDYLISALWIAGIINAMNIIDIMDGLASGVALFVSLSLVSSMYFLGFDTSLAFPITVAVVLFGACLGFLPYNFEKATIFMGDAGSTVLGFLLGTLTLALPKAPQNMSEIFVPLFFLGVPVFDVVLVSILRLKKGMSPMMGSKDHFALRLKKHGFSVKEIVSYSWACCCLLGMMAVLLLNVAHDLVFFPIVIILGFSFLLALILAKIKMEA